MVNQLITLVGILIGHKLLHCDRGDIHGLIDDLAHPRFGIRQAPPQVEIRPAHEFSITG